jgi:hypothetical protein
MQKSYKIKKKLFDFKNIKNTEKKIINELKKNKIEFDLSSRVYENSIKKFY